MTRNVLIVDDSDSLRYVAGIVLRGKGYEVLEACNGEDAIAKLGNRKIDLIISDINMPVMDGIAFIRVVKALPNHKFTPIIMLTVNSSESERKAARVAGVKAWMVKPFSRDQLLEMVARFVMP